VIARLAKTGYPTNSVNMDVVKFSDFKGKLRTDKNVITVGTKERNDIYKELGDKIHLDYLEKSLRLQKRLKYSGVEGFDDIGMVEQIISPWNNNMVVMTLYGKNDNGISNAASIFDNDKKFEGIQAGNLAVIAGKTVRYVQNLSNTQLKEQNTYILETNWFKRIYKTYFYLVASGILLIFLLISMIIYKRLTR